MTRAELFIVDRASRLVVHGTEFYLPLATVREILGRPPAVDRPDLTSWGRVTGAELEALLQAVAFEKDELEQEIRRARRLVAAHPLERAVWSLVFSRDH